MNMQILPYIGIVLSVFLVIYIQLKETIQYWKLQYKNKVNGENTKFDFTKSTLDLSFAINILLLCIIWAICLDSWLKT